MSCSPTATLYNTLTTYTASTSFSLSNGSPQAQLTTIVQQSCLASGTISGSSVGCISSTEVSQLNTVAGDGQGQVAQVPIVVSIPVIETIPTQTLFAPCTGGDATPSSSPVNIPVTTSVLVQSTPPPSTLVEPSSTTLADGSVVQTVVTVVSTVSPTAVYVPTTSLVSPTLQGSNSNSHGSGTNVAPIVGGVLGGFIGLVAIVASLWWLCRRRRSWDDIFEKDEPRNDDAWVEPAVLRRPRGSRGIDASAEPQPYQYGLVGRVVPPAAAGEALRTSQYGSVSEASGAHSRQTSLSATPLLQATRSASSRPSTSASVYTQSGSRARSHVASTEAAPRSLSMVSYSSASGALLDGQSTPALLGSGTDDLVVAEPLIRTGSPVPSAERRILQVVNDETGPSSEPAQNVIMHMDGGPVAETDEHPPAYSR